MSLHGDGVPVAGQSLEAITISGVLSRGLTSADCKLLLSGRLSSCKSKSTIDTFWSVLLWSLMAMTEGRYPGENHDGEPYSSGILADRAGTSFAGGMFSLCSWCAVISNG